MAKLIECVPNFSCSREKDPETFNALVAVAESIPGCLVFDVQTDGDHNRCVFTLVGTPKAMEEAALASADVAPYLAGKTIRKLIAVPGRIVTIVVA